MPTLIQEFYISVYVQIKVTFFVPYFFNTIKKQIVLIRLFTIYCWSNCSSLKFMENSGKHIS